MTDRRLPDHALRRLLDDATPLLEETRDDAHRIGRYTILRELGRGGMGVVWEAEDPELGRHVALKVLAVPVAGDVLRERFRREAQAVARLSHPNIAQVYETTGDAIAMQLIDGPPLSRTPLDDRRRLVTLLRDAALAVHHAHERGIIHRDLKPHNLLVEGDRVYVTDFGLAKELDSASSLSLSGHVLGTPAYMAPEQARGSNDEIDPRTDVYGLGATLYHLLGGRPPHRAGDVAVLLRRVVEDDPAPLRSLASDVPRDLELVVRKCLEKEPARRYASAQQLADDLTRWLEGMPVLAEAPSVFNRTWRYVRRHPTRVGFGVAALVAVIALNSWWNSEREARTLETALVLANRVGVALDDARILGAAYRPAFEERLDRIIGELNEFVSEHDVPRAWFALGRLLHARGQLEEALDALDRACTDPSIVAARVTRGLVRVELLASQLATELPPVFIHEVERMSEESRAEQESALADLLFVRELGEGEIREVDEIYVDAEIYRLRGQLAAARSTLAEVVGIDKLHVGARRALSQIELAEGDGAAAFHASFAEVDIYRGLGAAYLAGGDEVDRTARQFELDAADRRVASGDRSPEALMLRGNARLAVRDVEGALADLTATLEKDPDNALAYGHRAIAHARRAATLAAEGKIDDAVAAWGRAIADDAAALTIDDHLVGALNNRAVARLERARLLRQAKRDDEAWEELRRAKADLDAAVEQAPRFGLAWFNRALLHRRTALALARAKSFQQAQMSTARAKADLLQVLELSPGDARALLERALVHGLELQIYGAKGDVLSAERVRKLAAFDHDAAVSADPDDARARGLRGVFLIRTGQRLLGEEDVRAALKMAPGPGLRRMLEKVLRDGAVR